MLIYSNGFTETDLALSRENGFGIEVLEYTNPASLDDFENSHPKVARLLHGIKCASMHGAYRDLFSASTDPLIREVTKQRFVQSIQAARFHKIGRVVFHSPYKRAFDGYSKAATQDFLKRTVDFWLQFEENIPNGITVYVENVEDDKPEVFARIFEETGSGKIRCCFDIGHAHCNSAAPVGEWLDVLGDFVQHVHLHDNDGKSDQHLPLGKGNAPLFNAIIKVLGRSGTRVPFVLECDVFESAKWLDRHGFDIFD